MKCWIALFVAIVSIQCIKTDSSAKIFVGNLSWHSTDEGLRMLFEEFGVVLEATVIRDRDTGRSRGFGFVTMSTSDEANKAIDVLNETEFDGRRIRVNLANSRGGNRPQASYDQSAYVGNYN